MKNEEFKTFMLWTSSAMCELIDFLPETDFVLQLRNMATRQFTLITMVLNGLQISSTQKHELLELYHEIKEQIFLLRLNKEDNNL